LRLAHAASDGPNMMPLKEMENLLRKRAEFGMIAKA
jgi:3-deoxy-D-manno-octulosonic acid (KDO) 8-phosphate synthase